MGVFYVTHTYIHKYKEREGGLRERESEYGETYTDMNDAHISICAPTQARTHSSPHVRIYTYALFLTNLPRYHW